MRRVFLLSPASMSGRRAAWLLDDASTNPLAVRLRAEGAPLGEVYAFVSGLYFRGKLAYARAFARPPAGVPGALVIVPGRGLVDAESPVTVDDLAAAAAVPVDATDDRYRIPLAKSALELAGAIGEACRVALLGSIASGKYVDVLVGVFGERLEFPAGFVGRGDLSRGGLMLRCVDAGVELEYVPVIGATRRGPRPPRLPPRRG